VRGQATTALMWTRGRVHALDWLETCAAGSRIKPGGTQARARTRRPLAMATAGRIHRDGMPCTEEPEQR